MYTTKIACHIEVTEADIPHVTVTQSLHTKLARLQDCICSKLKKFGLSLIFHVLHDLDNRSSTKETIFSIPVKHCTVSAHTVVSKLDF